MHNNLVILMAKWPEPGKVKTRLAKDIGNERAAAIYSSLLKATIESCSPESSDNFRLGLYCDPPDKTEQFESAFPQLSFHNRQTGNNLGDRMFNACSHLFETTKACSVILIGADIPALGRSEIRKALSMFELGSDIVCGPTEDGGYYLLGMKKPEESLFKEIDWGTDTVFAETVNRIKTANLVLGNLPVLEDIDTLDDLKRLNIPDLRIDDL